MLGEATDAETAIVVAVVRVVPVAVGRAAVPGIVVPRAAAQQLGDPPTQNLPRSGQIPREGNIHEEAPPEAPGVAMGKVGIPAPQAGAGRICGDGA